MISMATQNPLSVANDLRPVLLRLTRGLRQETEQFGITGRQVSLMALIDRSPGVQLKQLAVEEGISPPSLSGHIDRLERAGYIERARSQVDRRSVGLVLTAAGARILERVRDGRTAWLAERLGTLDPGELAVVAAAIGPLLRIAEQRQ